MPYPIGLLKDEKDFLNRMFACVPQLYERFNEAVNTYPDERLRKVPEWLRNVRRGLWAEMNIPDTQAGTLADHVTLMNRLAVQHTKDMDLQLVFDMIFAKTYPQSISGDYAFSRYVSKEDADELEELANRLLYDTSRGHRYPGMFQFLKEPQTEEELWVHDLDLIATFIKSREFETSHASDIQKLQQDIKRSILTDQGKLLLQNIPPAPSISPGLSPLPLSFGSP